MRLFPAGWIIAIVCYMALAKHSWNDYSPFFVPPPVSCFANSNTTRSLPIYGTDFTGFPWSKESSSRFAYSFSSVDPTRLQFTSPRCCMRVQRPTRNNLRSDTRLDYDIPRCSSVRSGPRSFAVSRPDTLEQFTKFIKRLCVVECFQDRTKSMVV